MYELAIVPEADPLLVGYLALLRAKTVANRRRIASRIAAVRDVTAKVLQPHQELMGLIARSRTRARLHQKGIASTESMDALQAASVLGDNLNDAEKFLLKKAYRKAASMCHPDRGGSTAEFQAVVAAYRSGDLTALNEYVKTKESSTLDQINYWKSACERPDIEWVEFQATNEYALARMYQQGRKAEAQALARRLLEQHLAAAVQEELSFN